MIFVLGLQHFPSKDQTPPWFGISTTFQGQPITALITDIEEVYIALRIMSQPQGAGGYPAPVNTATTTPAYTPMSTAAATSSSNSGGDKLSNATVVGIAIAAVVAVVLLIIMFFLIRKSRRRNARGDALSKLDGSAPSEEPSIRFSEMFPKHGTEKDLAALRASNLSKDFKAPRSSTTTVGTRKSAMRKSSNLNPASHTEFASTEKLSEKPARKRSSSDDDDVYDGVDW